MVTWRVKVIKLGKLFTLSTLIRVRRKRAGILDIYFSTPCLTEEKPVRSQEGKKNVENIDGRSTGPREGRHITQHQSTVEREEEDP